MITESAPPVALITGAAKRIGAAIARALHTAGYNVALHFRHSATAAADLQAELDAVRPGSTLLLQAELADISALPGLVQSTLARFGHLDALINNASAFYPTPIGTTTAEQWDDLFVSNAKALFF